MKLLAHCAHLVEAQHWVNLLRAVGIRAEVRKTYLAGALGEISFLDAGPEVWVEQQQDLAAARAVIAQAGPPDQPPWRCEQCGEWLEGQFSQCWQCGAERPPALR